MARLSVFALALVLIVAVTLPLAATADCSSGNPNDTHNTDDVVNTWGAPCDAGGNARCKACTLWTLAQRDKTQGFSYSSTPGKPYRAKIMPTIALQGLENIVNTQPRSAADHATFNLWARALDDAAFGKVPSITTRNSNHPIAWINSLNARTMHHLHIHIGTPTGDAFYQCAKKIINAQPAAGTWDSATGPTCDALSSNKSSVTVRATTTTDANGINQAIRDGFKKQLQADILSDQGALRTGVLVQKAPKGNNYLVFLITGSHVNDYSIFQDKH